MAVKKEVYAVDGTIEMMCSSCDSDQVHNIVTVTKQGQITKAACPACETVSTFTRGVKTPVGGATGKGKSVGIGVVFMSMLYKKHPSQVKLILIDPKKVELFPYSHLENHFLGFLPDQTEPIVTDTTKVVHTLNSLIIEMETRYDRKKKAETRKIPKYQDKAVQIIIEFF